MSARECPAAHYFDPLDPGYLADPYPVFADLRAAAPVHFSPELDMWLVSRFDDVDRIFRDPETYSAAIAQSPVYPPAPGAAAVLRRPGGPAAVMSNLDPPEHTRLRRHNMQTFSARRIRKLEAVIDARVAELVEALPRGTTVDFVPAVTFPLPAATIFTLLGFPEADFARLKAWSDDRLFLVWGRLPADQQEQVAENFRAFFNYCAEHVARRAVEPADDFATDLLAIHREDPEAISHHEIASIVFGLSFAGHETTTNLLSNAVVNCVGRPAIWSALREDPGHIPAAVEEVLRFDSSVICWRRVTRRAVDIGGVSLPEGARLLLMLGSANRDPAAFEDPDDFRLDRPNASRHVSFGRGIHFCLGATLARMQVASLLRALVERLPEIELAADVARTYPANVSFRGPRELPVVVTAATD